MALVLVTADLASASPMETKPPPPLVDRPDTRPTPSVVMLMSLPVSAAPVSTLSVTVGLVVAVAVAACTLMTPPPPPMAEAVTVRSPEGAPTKLSVPRRSISWKPAPGAMSTTSRCSPLPRLFRSTPCIANRCRPPVRAVGPGFRVVIGAPPGVAANWKVVAVGVTTK